MSYRNRSRISNRLFQMISLLAAFAVLTSGVGVWNSYHLPSSVSAEESEDDLREQKEDLAAEQERLEALRNEQEDKLASQEEKKDTIEQQIALKIEEIEINQQLISDMNTKIDEASYEIAVREQNIAEKESQIAAAFADLQVRLRTISKTGALTSMLQMIMSADGFLDYLLKAKAMECVAEDNEALMNAIDAEMQAINAEKDALEKQKMKIEKEREPYVQLQSELLNAKMDLDVLYSEANAVTEQLSQDIDYYNAQIAEAEAQQAMLQEKIDELIRIHAGSGQSYVSGSMYWPAPSCTYISSTFKFRWGKWHNGIDMCGGGCYGTAVAAGADGIVTFADWMGGYGWCVVIDHGIDESGYNVTTLYAHCSDLYVSEGQAVSGGETIAAIGSSGNSTGPHLHFEVRLDGEPLDPISNGYLSTAGVIIDESL